jgi:nucleotide-binding universal stress UspA family protein
MTTRKFLVVADDTPEVAAALRYACRRASSTGGRVSLLRTLAPTVFEHWSGVREEIERQTRAEAEAVLQRLAEQAVQLGCPPPELLLKEGEPAAGIRAAVSEDPDIKVLVLAAAVGGRGPGPLVSTLAKEGVSVGGRRLAVTIVPGDLTDEEIADLA